MKKTKKPAAKRAAVKRPAAKRPAKKKAELLVVGRATKRATRSAGKRPAASAKRPVRAAAKPQYKHCIEVKKTARGDWKPVGAGGNDPEAVKKLARIYASNYPDYSFRVV